MQKNAIRLHVTQSDLKYVKKGWNTQRCARSNFPFQPFNNKGIFYIVDKKILAHVNTCRIRITYVKENK